LPKIVDKVGGSLLSIDQKPGILEMPGFFASLFALIRVELRLIFW
jgi:hypothetical protein